MPSFPATYLGSLRTLDPPPPKPSDHGQFFKVHLLCGQSISVSGSATENTLYGGRFKVDLYDGNQQLAIPQPWVNVTTYSTSYYQSSTFVNPNSAASDFYIRVYCDYYNIQDFTINIASNEVDNPRPVAPDATGGMSPNSEEYHFTPSLSDRNDVLTGRDTELWAKIYWPSDFSGGPYPLAVFLHGNHGTCGITGTSPRVDDENGYTYFGTCGVWRFFVSRTGGTARNDSAGWFGMKITTGPDPLVVKSLGRIFISGNTGTHTIKIVRASDNVQIGSASLSMANGVNDKMRYQDLSSPVTLAANTAYYIVSQEFVAGDQWYDSNATITGTGVATVSGPASSSDGASWTVGSTPGHSYGLVDFVYDFTTGRSVVQNHLGYEYLATQLASRGYVVASINANRGITGANDGEYVDDPKYIFARGRLVLKHLETLSKWNSGPTRLITVGTLGTSRKNATGWFGMQITVGPQPITIYSLGRMFLTGNNQTHNLEIVRAGDNVVITPPSLSISMAGGTNGTFKYVDLSTPVRLAANTSYYIASQETRNKDSWYDSNTTVSSTSLATVNGRVTSSNGTTWDTSGAVPGQVYVPLDFKYQVPSVNLTGKIDFANVGLMGHSRGGQGVRAVYNLYRDPNIDSRGTFIAWSTKVPGMNIKGIFEIAPTDTFVPTSPMGGGARYLNADGTAWNVLLPMCDGDVLNLEGVRGFDRLMAYTGNSLGIPADSPATQKSTYTVWGANHNSYNTEWQGKDPFTNPSGTGCVGVGNTALFPNPPIDSSGSPNQRTTALASLLAFFRGNVGTSASPTFNQNFNPRYTLPSVVSTVTRVDQGFTPSPNSTITKVGFDFTEPLPDNQGYVITDPAVAFDNGVTIPEHDYVTNPVPCYAGSNPPPCPSPSPSGQIQSVGIITWSSSSCNTYFQAEWSTTGDNVSGYQTLDFRISRKNDTLNDSNLTNFQIQLVGANGNPTGDSVSVNKYVQLTGPVGTDLLVPPSTQVSLFHSILQTVRIPLTDFASANLTQIRGVRFIFSDSATGAIYLANIRLSNQP